MPLKRDKLTDLIHESELPVQLDTELERARRYAGLLSVVLVEPLLDDSEPSMPYAALKRLAQVAQKTMRSVDKGIRFRSGMLYILPGTSNEGAHSAVDKIRRAQKAQDTEKQDTFRVSVYAYDGAAASRDQKRTPAAQEVLDDLLKNSQ